jgi:hypothetical protein
LSFTQLSIWSNKFLGKGLVPTILSNVHNSRTQRNFPCKKTSKEWILWGSSNIGFDFATRATSKMQKSCNKYPIVKLRSFGHNSFEHWTYLSSPCPWAILLVKVIGNCLSLDIILLHTYNLRRAFLTWSILSWITHRNSSFDQIDFVFHVWYKFHTFPIWISTP